MSDSSALKRNAILSGAALLSSLATLVCCVLPAVLVALGAGAVLAGLVSAVPQLIWLSEHKGLVFGSAGVLLALSGGSIWYARSLPCPVDPVAAHACTRIRRFSAALYGVALVSFALGVTYTFILPRLNTP